MGPTRRRAHQKHSAARRSLASLGLLSGCAADRLRRFV
nr:MAG TPA: Prokaryotic membrane lipoprotein lipid attachment site [Caudoviricetes sp.]DAS60888.1 MAG TPA: Prokaryotic membrane lipoprotein lipid attachment site [Caudoviricetes sp.]